MLNKLFAKPLPGLEIQVAGQPYHFAGISDFEFALAGRTAVPSGKIQRLVRCSMQELRAEARTIKDVERRFVDILSQSIEQPKSINRSLRELDPLIFSQDHHWREIIDALNETGDEYDAYRRVALVKYLQYLSARQDIIKHLYSEKKKYSSNGNGEGEGELKDTLILDSAVIAETPGADGNSDFERMPKGESIQMVLAQGKEIDIMLSKHKCKLCHQSYGLEYQDEKGGKHRLNAGRNTVGRDALSTVVADPAWRDVSRLHLVIEVLDNQTLQLTDMSSHGTYLPSACFEQTAV
jgi:hypothetical protein